MLLAPQLMTASLALLVQRGPIAPPPAAVMRTAVSPAMKIPQSFTQPAMAAIVAATIAFAPIDAVHAATKSATKSRPNVVQTKSGLKTVPAASASKAAAPSTSTAPKASASTTAAPSATASDSRTGGRIGGRAPAPAAAPAATAAGAPAAPAVTNVIIQQPMQPMYGGGMGYGQPMMGGGGGGGMGLLIGAELVEAFMKEQQRQAMLKQQLATQQQLGADQAADPHMSQSATPSSHDMHQAVHNQGPLCHRSAAKQRH